MKAGTENGTGIYPLCYSTCLAQYSLPACGCASRRYLECSVPLLLQTSKTPQLCHTTYMDLGFRTQSTAIEVHLSYCTAFNETKMSAKIR